MLRAFPHNQPLLQCRTRVPWVSIRAQAWFLASLLVLFIGARSASAFSLLGPLDAHAWQTPALGYDPVNTDIGNPMNLGEEYRWNNRRVTYAFDESFLNYFGQHGVEAIEAAIRILNQLPPASQINVDDFPTENKRLNGTAQSLGVQDLKSTALSLLLEVFGLAAPERWTWALRGRGTITVGGTTITNYIVINRNFDPLTLQPTNRVNGASYGFTILEFTQPQNWADAMEFQLDPLEFGYSSVAGAINSLPFSAELLTNTVNIFAFGVGGLGPGEIFTGLTRDDAGGWRYLHRRPNWNVEQTPPNTSLDLGPGGGVITNAFGPWTPIFVNTNTPIFTNIFTSNAPPWTPFIPSTNVVTNIFGTNITNFAVIALRPGVDKIRFQRVNFDSLLGQSFSYTNRWNDTVISNFTRVTQNLMQIQTAPDLLFAAGDLGTTVNARSPVLVGRGINRVNNDALNGFTARGGPGVLQAPALITFSDILDAILMSTSGNFSFSGQTVVWGSFDETSDDIIVFPNSLSLEALEELLNLRSSN